MDIENLYKGKGGYVFVSHSHLDIEQVRKIRNFLEDSGMEPILFYLRSMDCEDKEKLKTLKRLIFDEIDACMSTAKTPKCPNGFRRSLLTYGKPIPTESPLWIFRTKGMKPKKHFPA